jgi:murein DD-endopeptidase MepM/ murein hydrolase activator NlpD
MGNRWLWLALALGLGAGCGGDDEPEVLRGRVQFGFPVAQPELIDQFIGVDHDPVVQAGGAATAICTGYDGRLYPWCYDEHHGSDYILAGAFETMDAGSTGAIAAAAGRVISVHDGEYDRCHIDGIAVSCDGNPMIANHVIIEHEPGVVTRYWHLKKDSVVVTEGQEVACGEMLGLLGSSGNSSFPHLHFQVEVDDEVLDPYAGEFSQPETWWAEQGGPEELPGPGCTAGS